LKELAFDLVFVIGWTQLIRPEALNLPRLGMIGAHASLLPHNRGRAPINWALIKGERQTGNSLMWLGEGIDRGDIIDQVTIPVTLYDTCASLYEKVAETNRDMILRVLPGILAGRRPGRKPEDGLVNWSMSSNEVYNFLRALTAPYPGAFSWLDGKRWFLWQCSLLPHLGSVDATPGQIVGSIYSPVESACGQVVACGTGAVTLLNVEGEDGRILKGRVLSDQPWKGKTWTNGG
jgi:methionyl-tRNA formyltransferase